MYNPARRRRVAYLSLNPEPGVLHSHAFAPAPSWSRAVIKVGSQLVAPDGRGCSTAHLLGIAQFIQRHRRRGQDVILVSSGAVAAGLSTDPTAPTADQLSIPQKQAYAAIGQSRLMQHWSRLFDVPCAQMLLTYDDLQRRNRYVNAQNTVSELLEMGVLPVVNENDTVATEELRVGDNDNLAAYVAVLADADLLIICSDVDGLYDADPRVHSDTSLVPVVETIDRDILAMAGAARSGISTGGMRTKLQAAEKATQRGVNTVLLNGRTTEPLDALSEGTVRGTLFKRSTSPLPARKHWMLHALPSAGRVVIDAGAARALTERGASLLPSGIVDVQGDFSRGDAVEVARENGAALGKGITQYSAADVGRIRGAQSYEVPDILGVDANPTDYVIHRDDLVLRK